MPSQCATVSLFWLCPVALGSWLREGGADLFNEFTRKNWRYLDDARCWATAEPADDYAIMAVLLESRLLR